MDLERFWKDGEIEQLSPSGFARADFRFLTCPRFPWATSIFSRIHAGFRRIVPSVIRCYSLVCQYGIYTYLYIGDFPFRFCGRWILLFVRLLQK